MAPIGLRSGLARPARGSGAGLMFGNRNLARRLTNDIKGELSGLRADELVSGLPGGELLRGAFADNAMAARGRARNVELAKAHDDRLLRLAALLSGAEQNQLQRDFLRGQNDENRALEQQLVNMRLGQQERESIRQNDIQQANVAARQQEGADLAGYRAGQQAIDLRGLNMKDYFGREDIRQGDEKLDIERGVLQIRQDAANAPAKARVTNPSEQAFSYAQMAGIDPGNLYETDDKGELKIKGGKAIPTLQGQQFSQWLEVEHDADPGATPQQIAERAAARLGSSGSNQAPAAAGQQAAGTIQAAPSAAVGGAAAPAGGGFSMALPGGGSINPSNLSTDEQDALREAMRNPDDPDAKAMFEGLRIRQQPQKDVSAMTPNERAAAGSEAALLASVANTAQGSIRGYDAPAVGPVDGIQAAAQPLARPVQANPYAGNGVPADVLARRQNFDQIMSGVEDLRGQRAEAADRARGPKANPVQLPSGAMIDPSKLGMDDRRRLEKALQDPGSPKSQELFAMLTELAGV